MADVPGSHDLELTQGATLRRTFTWTIDGDPVDLTGCTARATIRATATSAGDPKLALTSGSGLTLGGVSGEVEMVITDEQTEDDLGGVWDLFIDHPGGDTTPLLKGAVRWHPTATR